MKQLSISNSSTIPIYDVSSTLQEAADNLTIWASQNQMAIHPDKTKVMLLGTQKKLGTTPETPHVNLGGTPLTQSYCENSSVYMLTCPYMEQPYVNNNQEVQL